MKKILALAALLATFSLTALPAAAQNFTPPSLELNSKFSGEYNLDSRHASVTWRISHLGFSNYTARFNGISGTLKFDADNPSASKVDILIDPTTVDTGLDNFDKKLQGAEWFNTEKFPSIRFVSTKVTVLDKQNGLIDGELSFLGQTKPVQLKVQFNGAGHNPFANAATLGFSATASLKRSDFGMSTYLPAIGDNVTLQIEAEFNLKPSL